MTRIRTRCIVLFIAAVSIAACASMTMKAGVVNLDVLADGTFVWNGQKISGDTLSQYLEAAAGQNPQPEIHLRPDREAKYDVLAQVLRDAQRLGVHNFGFVGTVNP